MEKTEIMQDKVLILDVETTFSNKGNPFDLTNKLVCIGCKWLNEFGSQILYNDFEDFQYTVDKADVLVGFNIKFDLHWLRRAGISFEGKTIWDCQIGEFILNNQLTPYPSLDNTAEKYNFDKKLDIVKTEYWGKGIDTDSIPKEILDSYLIQDLAITEKLYLKQVELFSTKEKNKLNLFRLQNFDLVVLEEIEWNGIRFNSEKALAKANELEKEIDEINKDIISIIGDIPFNLSSNDHVSAILYGGSINVDTRIPIGVYKTGKKIGETRYKIVTKSYNLPRLVSPMKGTETVKEGFWKVNEDVLKVLPAKKEAKKIIELLKKYSTLEKLRGTYLVGWSNLIKKMNWEEDTIHGNLNQCVVVTGRLSSTKPNLQNADPNTKTYCETRYKNI